MCCYARPMLNRRTAIQAFAAGTAMLALPSMVASAQPPTRKPPRLRRGDTVGLIEPAGFTDDEFDLALVEETVRAMGLVPKAAPHLLQRYGRSEEHTSELQSLMRNSYAVFCLKKK